MGRIGRPEVGVWRAAAGAGIGTPDVGVWRAAGAGIGTPEVGVFRAAGAGVGRTEPAGIGIAGTVICEVPADRCGSSVGNARLVIDVVPGTAR